MRKTIVAAALALSFLSVGRAAADDAKTYTLPARETWKAGDVVTRSEQSREKLTIKTTEGAPIEQSDKTVDYTAVMKVVEVNAEGDYTRALVYFTKWSRKSGEAVDTSLEGKHVELTGAAKARTVKVLTPDANVSKDAGEWLKSELAKENEGDSDRAMAPKKPLAVGESWSPDLAELAKAFSSGMKLAVDKSKATLTLSGVEGEVATVAVDFELQTGSLATPQGVMEWSEGGLFEMKGDVKKGITPGSHHDGAKMAGTLKGTLKIANGVLFDLATEQESTSAAGGEMPDAPAAK